VKERYLRGEKARPPSKTRKKGKGLWRGEKKNFYGNRGRHSSTAKAKEYFAAKTRRDPIMVQSGEIKKIVRNSTIQRVEEVRTM